jgi:hypothetical protein
MRDRPGCYGVGLGPLLAAQMGIGRPQVGGGGGGGAWGSKFWIWGAGFPIWAFGSTSGFSAARRYGGKVGPNGTMRHILRAALYRRG